METGNRWDHIWSEKRRATSGKLGSILARDIIHRTVAGILEKEIPDPQGKRILEEGSGTGLVSLDLARSGSTIFLLDKSEEALALSRINFGRAGADFLAVQASILDLPFGNESFDIVWSGGVIEHFKEEEQVRILKEMLRVSTPEGRVIVIAPSADARIYSKAKRHADRRKAWQPGYEAPVLSLKYIADKAQAEVIREYRTGLLAELHFLKYYFGDARALRFGWAALVEIISRILSPLNRRPGYLLVSILKK
jgi:ubiquinone/menaquinone biosynthesis C-methylase UbiE